jgi:predicted RNA polymerase sigma factor
LNGQARRRPARIVRDLGLAEELAQDALVTALAEWPKTGGAANPGAWLIALARADQPRRPGASWPVRATYSV